MSRLDPANGYAYWYNMQFGMVRTVIHLEVCQLGLQVSGYRISGERFKRPQEAQFSWEGWVRKTKTRALRQ